jgi:hypothetical protein
MVTMEWTLWNGHYASGMDTMEWVRVLKKQNSWKVDVLSFL